MEGERRAVSTNPSTGHVRWDLSSLQGVDWKHSPTSCCFAGVFQQDLLLGLVFWDWEHSWEGGNVSLWSLVHGQLKGQGLPLFPGVFPRLSWRAELLQSYPRAGPCSSRDVLEGCSPGLIPSCPSVPPCKACSAPAKGENGPKPCGFLVGVNTGNASFHSTFHWCLSVVQPFSNSLSSSQSSVPLRGWEEQSRALPAVAFPCLAR